MGMAGKHSPDESRGQMVVPAVSSSPLTSPGMHLKSAISAVVRSLQPFAPTFRRLRTKTQAAINWRTRLLPLRSDSQIVNADAIVCMMVLARNPYPALGACHASSHVFGVVPRGFVFAGLLG